MQTNKILYVASTESHLKRFHQSYIAELKKTHTVLTMANGTDVDFYIPFAKSFFSPANFKCVWQIRRILKKEHFQSVLLHTTLAAVLVRLAMLGIKNRPYVLNVVHGYLFPKTGSGFKNRFLLFCEKCLWRVTDDIAVMNREDLEIASSHRLCRNKVYMTNGMGIPPHAETEGANIAEVRAEWGISESDFLCTFVGELSGRKNQAFLIECIKRLRTEDLPVKLLLLGEGSERSRLETMLSEQGLDAVFLAGNREPVAPYLAATDLYVSASRSEGLPFNIMEAMDMGLPILASDTKGQNDLLPADMLYSLDDQAAFCKALKEVYESGNFGKGSRTYPNLNAYRLPSVFDANMKILMLGSQSNECKP